MIFVKNHQEHPLGTKKLCWGTIKKKNTPLIFFQLTHFNTIEAPAIIPNKIAPAI